MKRADKQAIVEEVAKVASDATAMVAAFYRGLTVEQMTDLRVKARAADVYLRVVRNTLARRALANTHFACLQEKLAGPLLLAFATKEPSAAARVLRDFAKTHALLKVTALALDETVFGAEQLEMIAQLPTRDKALSMLMAAMQAPTRQLARALSATNVKLVRTLAAVADQKRTA